MSGALPQFVSHFCPCGCFFFAFIAVLFCSFLGLIIGALRSAFRYQFGKRSGIIQYGTGTKQIVIEGLIPAVTHKQRGLQRLQQSLFPNVGVRIMDKRTRLDISARIDVQIPSAPAIQPPT